MAYISLMDIRSAAPQVPIGPNTKPSEGQVDAFIAETESYVDAVLTGIGYTTPVTSETALPIVREIVMAGVLARTLNARDLGVRDPEAGGGSHQQRKFDRMVEKLQSSDDPLFLKGATGPASIEKVATGYVRSQATTDEEREPDFTVGQEF